MPLVFKLHSETKIPRSVVRDAPQSGPFDDYAEWILSQYEIQVSLADTIKFLQGYGAWTDNELQDLEKNKARLLWLAVMDLKESGDSFWYMSS